MREGEMLGEEGLLTAKSSIAWLLLVDGIGASCTSGGKDIVGLAGSSAGLADAEAAGDGSRTLTFKKELLDVDFVVCRVSRSDGLRVSCEITGGVVTSSWSSPVTVDAALLKSCESTLVANEDDVRAEEKEESVLDLDDGLPSGLSSCWSDKVRCPKAEDVGPSLLGTGRSASEDLRLCETKFNPLYALYGDA